MHSIWHQIRQARHVIDLSIHPARRERFAAVCLAGFQEVWGRREYKAYLTPSGVMPTQVRTRLHRGNYRYPLAR